MEPIDFIYYRHPRRTRKHEDNVPLTNSVISCVFRRDWIAFAPPSWCIQELSLSTAWLAKLPAFVGRYRGANKGSPYISQIGCWGGLGKIGPGSIPDTNARPQSPRKRLSFKRILSQAIKFRASDKIQPFRAASTSFQYHSIPNFRFLQ